MLKRVLSIGILALALPSFAQDIDRGRNPHTPLQTELEALSPLSFADLTETRHPKEDHTTLKVYLREGKPYYGWALQIFPDNEHRYRYIKLENGIVTWQIGYYDNGDLDFDFRMKDGKAFGSQRMWRKNQERYIENYFLEGGVQHGMQYRWFSGNRLAEEAEYNNGVLLYRKQYNEQGELLPH